MATGFVLLFAEGDFGSADFLNDDTGLDLYLYLNGLRCEEVDRDLDLNLLGL